MQQSGLIALTQSVEARLILTMLLISQYQQWLVKKRLFSLKSANRVFFHAFTLISSVPVKARNLLPIDHFCILPSYTSKSSANKISLQISLLLRPKLSANYGFGKSNER